MALSEGQQQTLADIVKRAQHEEVSFEDEAGKFMQESLSPEEQQQAPDFQGQPKGLVEKEAHFSEEEYEEGLRQYGFTNRANERAAEKVKLERKQLQFKIEEQKHKTETMLLGVQMMQAGFEDKGMEMFNTTLIEGQKITKVKQLPNNKARVFTEDKPEGFITSIDGMVTMLTDANTQFKEREQARKATIRKEDAPKTPLAKKATTADTKQLAISLKDGTYDDLVPGVSDLSTGERIIFAKDLHEKAYGLQAKAQKEGYVLDAAAAREQAAQILAPRVKKEEGFMGIFDSYSYKAPGKKEDLSSPEVAKAFSGGGIPEEAASLSKGQSMVIEGVEWRRNSQGKLQRSQ